MTGPQAARDYHERDVRATYSVLIEIGQVLGTEIRLPRERRLLHHTLCAR